MITHTDTVAAQRARKASRLKSGHRVKQNRDRKAEAAYAKNRRVAFDRDGGSCRATGIRLSFAALASAQQDLATCHDIIGECNSLIDPDAYPEVQARIDAVLVDCKNPICSLSRRLYACEAERDAATATLDQMREWLKGHIKYHKWCGSHELEAVRGHHLSMALALEVALDKLEALAYLDTLTQEKP